MAQLISPEGLLELRTEWRREASCAVLAMGAFDLLHPGHVRLLEQARSLGDILVVAVQSDREVRSAAENEMGPGTPRTAADRPVVPLAERAEILAALAAVDFVTELRNVSADSWMERFAPDVYVRGGTRASGWDAPTAEKAASGGSRTVNIPLEPGYSTALLIERIQKLRQ